jgi:hypothetical protein
VVLELVLSRAGDAGAMAAVRASGPGEISGADDEAPPSAIYAMFEHDAVDLVRMDAATIGGLTG